MSLFRRESRAISYQDVWSKGGNWSQALGSIGLLDAVAQPTVHRCLQILGGMVAQMEPRTMRGSGAFRQEIDSPKFIASPSNVYDAYEWRFAGTVSLALAGEQIGLILATDAAGYPAAVEWVWPERVDVVDRGLGMRPGYRLDAVEIAPDRVWHRRNLVVPGNLRGVDPLSNAGLVEVAKSAREFGRAWFDNGATPSWLLQPERDPGAEGAAKLVDAWMRATGKKRKPVVVPQSVKATQVSVNADESQFLATQLQAKADIATALGIPAEMVGGSVSGGSLTYANRDQRLQDMLITTLNHYVAIWNRALSDALPRPQYVRLNTATILRSDLTTRLQGYQIAADVESKTGTRIYTEDEIRDLEDRPPLPAQPAPMEAPANA